MMNPIKGADGQDSIAKTGQFLQVVEYSHGHANVVCFSGF
jgi:hypothetical protein